MLKPNTFMQCFIHLQNTKAVKSQFWWFFELFLTHCQGFMHHSLHLKKATQTDF